MVAVQTQIKEFIADIYASFKVDDPVDLAYAKLVEYVNLVEANSLHFNLTNFKGEKLWTHGIYESLLTMGKVCDVQKSIYFRLLDIGSGAGFPSVPLKIIFPSINLTICESQVKRCQFLERVSEQLDLKITVLNNRVEDLRMQEKFDVVTARAVAPLFKLIEISHRTAKIHGNFFFIKGRAIDDEIYEAKGIIKKLKIAYDVITVETNLIEYPSFIFYYDKAIATPSDIPRLWKDIK